MAKAKKGTKKKGSSKTKKMSFGGIDLMKYLGYASGIFADSKGLEQMTWFTNLDAKAQAGVKMGIGEFAPKYLKPYLKGNESIVDGAGVALQVLGTKDLMTEFNMAGLGEDSDSLEVELDGIDDGDDDEEMNEDIMAEDIMGEDIMGDDDLSVVQGDDDLGVVQGVEY